MTKYNPEIMLDYIISSNLIHSVTVPHGYPRMDFEVILRGYELHRGVDWSFNDDGPQDNMTTIGGGYATGSGCTVSDTCCGAGGAVGAGTESGVACGTPEALHDYTTIAATLDIDDEVFVEYVQFCMDVLAPYEREVPMGDCEADEL